MRVSVHVDSQLQRLLAQEDSDGDRRISIRDRGPKRFWLQDLEGGLHEVAGTYRLSGLLQDLAWSQRQGLKVWSVEPSRWRLPPATRLTESIRTRCWDGLTRRLSRESLAEAVLDPKAPGARLYYPGSDGGVAEYYADVHGVEICPLPEGWGPEQVLAMNGRHGLLTLARDRGEPLPYLVPGGRFREMYGWDSYFIALGLLQDGLPERAGWLARHMLYQIEHYGAILNANRSYYLTRSQPPFLTSLLAALDFDESAWGLAAREYETVWMGPSRLTPCGLSRYFCSGIGMPPETLWRHYGQFLSPYAEEAGLSLQEFRLAYERRRLAPPPLDEYFREDRAVRESGHDTSYRLEGGCTRLCTVDLNSLLYKYETDLAERRGGPWRERAQRRRRLMHELCWDEQAGQFFDYDWMAQQRRPWESATNFWPLWAGLASSEQARIMIERGLPELLAAGGVAAGSRRSRGELSSRRQARQWDYPFGWAPHQILIWQGLRRYGYDRLASELAFRWLRMITQNAIDYNGVIPEKFDVVTGSHEVFTEYSNEGADFAYYPAEGFGWTNASYQIGLSLLNPQQRADLDLLTPSDGSQPSGSELGPSGGG